MISEYSFSLANISSSISSIPLNTFQTIQRNSIAFTTSTRNSATTSTKSITTTTKSTSQLQPDTIVCAQSTASLSNTIYIIIGSTVSIALLFIHSSLLNIVVYLINKRKNRLHNAQKGVPIELSFSESSESNACQSNNIDSTTQTMNSVSNPYMN